MREVKPWSQAFLRAAARLGRAGPGRPARPPLPGVTSLPRSPGRWFSCSQEPGEQSLRSQLHRVTWFCCVGCSISSRSSLFEIMCHMRGPHPPRRGRQPALPDRLAASSLSASPLPLNSPSPSRPLPVVLLVISACLPGGLQLGLPTGSLLLARALLASWLWPHQRRGFCAPPRTPAATSPGLGLHP